MPQPSRAAEVSSFTIIKGSLIGETYAAFCHWDLSLDTKANLNKLKASNPIGASSANWLRDVAFVLSRRFEPNGRDLPLVRLAQAGLDRNRWDPLLLWHMTRDEFLVRDFLSRWLYGKHTEGAYRLRVQDVVPYLVELVRAGQGTTKPWSEPTLARVASALLRMAVDFGLMQGASVREFVHYHLPEESFVYLLHAVYEREGSAQKTIYAEDWHLFMMDADDVERELFRLHQFRKLDYQVAGSLAQLKLPCATAAEYAEGMVR